MSEVKPILIVAGAGGGIEMVRETGGLERFRYSCPTRHPPS
jgi:hypothetical protein